MGVGEEEVGKSERVQERGKPAQSGVGKMRGTSSESE